MCLLEGFLVHHKGRSLIDISNYFQSIGKTTALTLSAEYVIKENIDSITEIGQQSDLIFCNLMEAICFIQTKGVKLKADDLKTDGKVERAFHRALNSVKE